MKRQKIANSQILEQHREIFSSRVDLAETLPNYTHVQQKECDEQPLEVDESIWEELDEHERIQRERRANKNKAILNLVTERAREVCDIYRVTRESIENTQSRLYDKAQQIKMNFQISGKASLYQSFFWDSNLVSNI